MLFLTQAIALVSEPPGSFVYHLLSLLALEAAFAIALGVRRNATEAKPEAGRLALAAGLALAVRLAVIVAAILGTLDLVSEEALLPPLDRAVSLTTILLVGWAVTFRPPQRWADAIAGTALLAVLIGAIVGVAAWYPLGVQGLTFNNSLDDQIWQGVQLAALLLLLGAIVWRRPVDWGIGLGLFGSLLLATTAHLLLALFSPLLTGHIAAFSRLADLAALPLFVVLVYRLALRHAAVVHVVEKEQVVRTLMVPSPGRSQPDMSLQAARALAAIGSSADVRTTLRSVTEGIAKALRADIALLWAAPAPDETLTCAGGYDLITEKQLEGFTVGKGRLGVLASSIIRGKTVRLRLPDHESELNFLAALLSLSQTGPGFVAPLFLQGSVYGALMIYSPYSQKEWEPEECKLLDTLAEPVSKALSTAEWASRLEEELSLAAEQRVEAEAEAQAARQYAEQVTTTLEELREESERDKEQLESLRALIDEQHAWIAQLPADMASPDEVGNIGAELQSARETVDKLKEQLRTTEAERQQLANELLRLESSAPPTAELNELRVQVAQLQAERAEVESELATAVADSTQLRSDLATLGEELAAAMAERDALAKREPEPFAVAAMVDESAVSGELRDRIEQLTAERDDASQRAVSMATELEELSTQLEVARQDAERLRTEAGAVIQDLQSQLAQAAATEPQQVADESEADSHEVLISLAQELRQPMSSIAGYTDLLLSESAGIIGAMQRKFLEHVKASSERLGSLIEDLVRTSALGQGALDLESTFVDVTGVIEDAIMSSSSQFREKGITLRMELEDELPTVQADRDALYQIMHHLLDNAAVASHEDGEVVLTARKEAAAELGGECLYVSIRDSGAGIPAEDYPRVFTRKYRADNPLIVGLGDTGVGLSLAKTLVENHGGRIWVESEPGSGSTFKVRIPVAGRSGNGATAQA